MTSPKQRKANRLNSQKSTGPKSRGGKESSAINATKHQLSLPVSEHLYRNELSAIGQLIREECANETQAQELAKRIVNFERNEAFLMSHTDEKEQQEIKDWGLSPYRLTLAHLAQSHKNKERVEVTFTTPNKKPKGKERIEEIKFIEGFLRLQDNALLGRIRYSKLKQVSSLRYQRRAINQLVKGLMAVANGQDL